jgi:hypothetical protein
MGDITQLFTVLLSQFTLQHNTIQDQLNMMKSLMDLILFQLGKLLLKSNLKG